MSFVSYAQNREDVLLWRALGHIKNGFYIDVGANDPVHDSVTQAFYQRGWWGINIEPVPGLHRLLCEQRPRDINLGIAAGAETAELTLFDLPEVNGWATANPEVAAAHRAEGHQVVEARVPVRTLNDICAEHVRGDIHFLKIDVEGFEEEVLRGIDLGRWRPWVLVVEATLPNSRETNHGQWEALATGHGYRFAWFDGLNRYYVAAEHPALLEALSVPPNVFDDYIPAQLDQAWSQLTDLSARQQAALDELEQARAATMGREAQHADELRALRAVRDAARQDLRTALKTADAALQLVGGLDLRAQTAEQELSSVRALHAADQEALQRAAEAHASASVWATGLEQQLHVIYASRSWRLTEPWRRAGAIAHQLRPRPLLRRIAMWAMGRPRLRQLALRLMRRYPRFAALVRGRVASLVHPAPAARVAQYVPPPHLANLPVSARAVLHDLQRESASHSAGNS